MILSRILLRNRYESVNDMLNKLSAFNVRQQVNFNVMKMLYKFEHNMMLEYMNQYFGKIQPYQFRNNNQFRLPRFASF